MELTGQGMDELLEEALKNYGAVEPRIGLEGRVLARLEAEREKPAGRAGWWALAATALVGALSLALFLSVPRAQPPARSPTFPTTARSPRVPSARPGVLSQAMPRLHPLPNGHPAVDGRTRPLEARAMAETLPKRDRFPTPAPLSDQEQMLAAYVQQFPREATRMAQAQTRLLAQEMKERELPATSGEKLQDPSQEQP